MSIESELLAVSKKHGEAHQASWDYDIAVSFREFCGNAIDPERIDEFCATIQPFDRASAHQYLLHLYG